jgi:hypothetical protein
MNRRLPQLPSTEIQFDYLMPIPDDNEKVFNPSCRKPFENVLEHRFSFNEQHRFWNLVCDAAHAASLSGGEYDGVPDACIIHTVLLTLP